MKLAQYMADRGNGLFRRRSFTPLLLLPLLWLERDSFHFPFDSHDWDLAWEFFSLSISLMGVATRIKTIGHIAVGTSGRNMHRQEAERLNTTGMYSIVRNPLYLGNYLILMGVILMTQSYELVIINSFIFALAYIPIVLREEEFLQTEFGGHYEAYSKAVPCFIPNFSLWSPPDLPFNLRMVLRREHDTWMSTITVFVILEHLRKYLITGVIGIDKAWAVVGISILFVWLVLKVLKKRSGLLRERPALARSDDSLGG